MIIVTGATGQLGRPLVEQLLRRVPAERVGVSVRSPEKLADLAARGVRVRRGDFAEPESLAHAFEGASQLLLVSVDATGPEAVARHAAAIDAARAAGVGRVLYTSHQGVSPTSPFPPMPDHAATERLLAESGIAYTSLRNGFYASTTLQLLGDALDSGKLYAPEDGPVSWTTHADLAEAAAVILADGERGEAPFDGPTPALTGPRALDLSDVARIAGEVTARPVERIVVPDDQWRDQLTGHGVPEPQADLLLGLFRASRAKEFAETGPTLGDLLGREPLDLHGFLTESL
ncbi:SDR family oxidoreductase [Streptomyces sp. NPDC088925]|uniref:SDR family oxidoreductase n=1 Tax=Streptomyces sp. NPDC088925 TaxID=3365914 RepID=UPI003817D12D